MLILVDIVKLEMEDNMHTRNPLAEWTGWRESIFLPNWELDTLGLDLGISLVSLR